MSQKRSEIDFQLHPKQALAFKTKANEVLYGGAVGGGKSFLMRAAAIAWCAQIPKLQVYLFRRLFPDLIKNHVEGPSGFRNVLAPWIDAGLVSIVEDEIRFNFNGSKIYLCHCKDEKDRFKYQGAEIHVLLVDEITHFTEVIYRFLRSRVRAVGLKLPEEYREKFPRILLSGNPGGVGHQWVKSTFVEPKPPLHRWLTPKSEGGMLRVYIPARLEDNPSMLEEDPDYADRVSGLGSPELVRAMREGDWNVVAGAFWPEFGAEHIIQPFEIPEHWVRFRALDWGSAKPFSVGWYAVSDGLERDADGEYVVGRFPKGSLIKYREWYGKSGEDVGLKLPVEDVAHGILAREARGEKIMYGVADPSIFKEDGGPSIAEGFQRGGVIWRRGDNQRIAGWNTLRARLRGGDGRPELYFFSTCLDSIRTFPVQQHDMIRPEDMDTDIEDHAVDECRYAVMSRPRPSEPRREVKVRGIGEVTFNELLERHDRTSRSRYGRGWAW